MNMRALIFKEEEIWSGVVLDHYIVAQGNSKEELMRNLYITIYAEMIERQGDLSTIEAAPRRLQDLWNPQRETVASTENLGGVEISLQHLAA